MRARVAAVTLLAMVAWLAWAVGGGGYGPVIPRSPATRPVPSPTPAAFPMAMAPPADVRLSRNIFEYSREPSTGSLPTHVPGPPLPLPTVAAPTPPPSVRLVGLVGSASGMGVALAIDGQVVVVAPGETELGYRVLAIEQDVGVRISGPDGERILPLP